MPQNDRLTFEAFARKWVPQDEYPLHARSDDLDLVEARFETYLPSAYREFMEQVGAFSTGCLLSDALLARGIELPMIQEFLSPGDVIHETECWRAAGLPGAFVAFASEGAGDYYCFSVVPENEPRPADASVWYFDHEERAMECLGVLFTEWLDAYAQIPRAAA